jgi:PAS domain S-box-containing protein
MSHAIKLLRNPHFWIISVIFLICIALHYPQQMPLLKELGYGSLLGLSGYAVERALFLLPIIYAGLVFGLRGGIVCLVAALAAMLPRVVLASTYPAEALFETCAVIAAGGLANWWLEARRRATGRREQALLKLEAVRRELQSYIRVIKENEKRLSALHAICAAVNRSLVLDEVLGAAADKIMEVMDIDVTLLFVLNEEAGELELNVHRGVSEEFARGVNRLRVGDGLNGWVAQTGEPLFVEDSPLDPRLSLEVVKREGIRSQFIVPLKSRDKVVGTLCVAVHCLRQFTSDEKELLALIGVELGVAIEKAHLYQDSQLSMRRFQELFEKAHDAIWVQDLEGKITAANQATVALTGYKPEELSSRNVAQFLTSQGLDLAREIRQKLLAGETVNQPYEQRIIRKDGREAILMLTTSVLGEKGVPRAFQHIARDITEERQLQKNLRLYIHQITKAHEEERSRMASELHDDTVQALVAISHRLDTLASKGDATPEEVLRSVEEVQRDVDGILQGIRRFAQDLRPPTLEYLGLLPALRELVSQVREGIGIDANLKVNAIYRHFAKGEEMLIYRIVQEALRNVWKHSEATKVDVAIESGDGKTRVTVSDNGKGFERQEDLELTKTGKLELIGMKERARLLGGDLTVRSIPNNGTTIILDLPDNRKGS